VDLWNINKISITVSALQSSAMSFRNMKHRTSQCTVDILITSGASLIDCPVMHNFKDTLYPTYRGKMADEVTQSIEDALNKIVHTTDLSGNMKKEFKTNIYETVSTLRNMFNKMKVMLEEEMRQETQTEKENSAIKAELEACKRANTKGKLETPTDREIELSKTVRRQVLPTHNHPQKLYSEVVVGRDKRKFQLTISPRDRKTPTN
jgi:tRNA threonylcarbamoyladenosine modification (KEOPS) complex  Pcc1 subunit